jgi:eukaryotic-like serine/threonine-protein kinase
MSESSHSPGSQIGAYELGPLLGAGGMGRVYRAHDTKLGRDVAIKILPAELTADPERLARFEREARVLARLNHPHIASIFGVEEADHVRALVLELVEGETLAQTIARGPLPLELFFEVAVALADAVEAAHAQGITHRDLKPSNVMLRPDARVKVLDFGIAKLRDEAGARNEGGATLAPLTEDGRVLGTAAYMSPEQAGGQRVDHRSDVFSLGAVLYEAATGRRPFGGDSALAQIAAVLTEAAPPPTRLRGDLPPALDAILARALEKNPDRRYQTAGELRDDLETLRFERLRGPGPPHRPRSRGVTAVAGLGAVAVTMSVAAVLLSPSTDRGTPLSVTGARQITYEEGIEATPALSPDGRHVAYERAGDIVVRDLAGDGEINLTPDSPAFDGEPAFSPDGAWIAFSSRRDGGEIAGGIWMVPASGGEARRLTNAGFSPAWSPDGEQIVYATEFVRGETRPTHRVRISALRAVSVRQGVTRLISEGDVAQPAWSPNGHRIAFWSSFGDGRPTGRPTPFTVRTMRPDGSEVVPLTSLEDFAIVWSPVWAPDGEHVYFCALVGGSAGVWRVAVDERSGQPLGEPEPVPLPATMVRHVALGASDGTIVWEAARDEANVHRIGFDPVSGVVREPAIAVTAGTRLWQDVDVSSEGRVVMSTDELPPELWVSDGDGTGLAPLFTDVRFSRNGRWSPDGTRLAFTSSLSGTLETWTAPADGSSRVRVSHFGMGGAGFFPIWSPDGARLAITTAVELGGETFLVDPGRDWDAQTLETLRPAPGDPSLRYRPWAWSPDGRRIAAYSERGAGIAVYSLEARSWEIVTSSGTMPRWLGDSRRLVYEDAGALYVIDADTKVGRAIHAAPGSSLTAPAMAPGDTTIYFVRTRLEREVWWARLR